MFLNDQVDSQFGGPLCLAIVIAHSKLIQRRAVVAVGQYGLFCINASHDSEEGIGKEGRNNLEGDDIWN